MRKGSTSLGSLGAICVGIASLILPITIAPVQPAHAAPRAGRMVNRGRQVAVRAWQCARERVQPNSSREDVLRVLNTRATWYGPGFHGRRTASGERFNRNAMTLASRHLPFGTRVRVTNPRTGRSAVARVNDRGPFGHRGYTADLSQGLARRIGLSGSGPVRLEILRGGRGAK